MHLPTLLRLAPLLVLSLVPPARAEDVDGYVRDQMQRQHIPGLALAVV
jgi:hypothetical protein